MMKKFIPALLCALALSGCAMVRFADGQRVAIEHESDPASLQEQADKACAASGGKPPASLISNLPLHDYAPAWMVRKVATFKCTAKD